MQFSNHHKFITLIPINTSKNTISCPLKPYQLEYVILIQLSTKFELCNIHNRIMISFHNLAVLLEMYYIGLNEISHMTGIVIFHFLHSHFFVVRPRKSASETLTFINVNLTFYLIKVFLELILDFSYLVVLYLFTSTCRVVLKLNI